MRNNGMNRTMNAYGKRGFFLLSLLLCAPGFGAEVEYVPTERYFQILMSEIDRAKSSIHAYIYLYMLHPTHSEAKTLRLAEALAAARRRGVRVEVVMDETASF